MLAKGDGKFRQTPSGRNSADLYDNIADLKKTQAPLIEFQTMRLFFLHLNLIEQKLELAQIAEKSRFYSGLVLGRTAGKRLAS